ncbi:S-layer homology domain-containing protein [Paenibacillus glycinis]|uniref:Uncharacterized protein n=1 Tax=Paenibacillus glycinis TaxID=2697035 RepID=A0ABW9Y034_9BACL|nr:S-layer homology domain-containing protein [Paenibacillus glycinis]NBD28352.1 hypothetical protein [Paenibacillus glycinis]
MNIGFYGKWRRAMLGVVLSTLLVTGIVPVASFAAQTPVDMRESGESIVQDSPGATARSEITGSAISLAEEETDPGAAQPLLTVADEVYGVPVLDPLPAYTKDASVRISGYASPGAAVTVWYSLNGGEETAAGAPAGTSDEGTGRGRFELTMELPEEGDYRFAASAEVNGQTGDRSAPVVITADWTAAGDVINVSWELLAYNRIELEWDPPFLETGPDPDVVQYRIYKEGDSAPAGETTDTRYVLTLDGSAPERYRIVTVDRAGNESYGEKVTVAASPLSETKLADLAGEYEASAIETAISGDGSTSVYTDTQHLYVIDNATGEKELISVTRDGAAPEGGVASPKVNKTGAIVVFSSDASNLTASPEVAGEHVYAYDRTARVLELISSPDVEAGEPAVSGDGRWVAYTENGHVYVYDRTAHTRKLVSATAAGEPESGISYGPTISGNGLTVAFLSTSTNLSVTADADESQSIYLYDAVSGTIVDRFAFNAYQSALTINEDGSYIAYAGADAPDRRKDAYLIDVLKRERLNLNDGRVETEVTSKTYGPFSISSNGHIVLANLVDSDPPVLYQSHYGEIFSSEQLGMPAIAGNPAMEAYAVAMDGAGNRLVYARGGALYTYCTQSCGETGPEQPITSAKWIVPASSWLGDQLKTGSNVTFRAVGDSGLAVQAVMTCKSGDSSQTKWIELTEKAEAPGIYEGELELTDGMAEITSAIVQLADGGNAMSLEHFPVKIAGKMIVDLTLDAAHNALLAGASLIAAGAGDEAEEMAIPLEWDPVHSQYATHYEIPLSSGDVYSVELRNVQAKLVLANQSGITLEGGRTVTLRLTPEFTATVKVTVNYSVPPSKPAVIVFKKEPSGELLAEVAADEKGEAHLPGLRDMGETITVSIKPPDGFKASAAQTVTLQLGANELSFDLYETSAAVGSVNMSYSRMVGQGNDAVPVMDSEAELRIEAKSGLQLQAAVSYLAWKGGAEPTAAERTIGLTEREPGHYVGAFLISEGISQIDKVHMIVDGERLPAEYPISKHVAGKLRISLDMPEGEAWKNALKNGELTVFYFSDFFKRHYELLRLSPDVLTYSFDVPYTGTPYRVVLTPQVSTLLPLELEAPLFEFGQTAEMTIKPKFNVQLKGTLRGENGEQVSGTYTLVDAHNDVVLQGNVNGSMDLRVAARYGARYRLQMTPSDSLYEPASTELAVDTLAKDVSMVLRLKPVHELSGRVIGSNGAPVAGVNVTATVKGSSRTFAASTKPDGSYSLRLPAGQAQLRATSNGKSGKMSKLTDVVIPERGEAEKDLVLLDYAGVNFKLYTKQFGSDWQGPVTFDWRVAYHYNLQASHAILSYGPPMQVAAVAGDRFRICLDGKEAQLPSACEETVIGDDNTSTVEMRLEGSGSQAVVSFVKPDGGNAGNVFLQFFKLDGSEADYQNLVYRRQGDQYVIELPTIGHYRLVAKGEDGLTAQAEFEVVSAVTKDLGEIVLHPAGRFGGRAGNGIGTSAELTTPGGTLTARILYNNANMTTGAAADAAIELELPETVKPLPGTLVVNGQAGTNEVRDGKLHIPLGDVAAGQSGVVQLGLHVVDNGSSNDLALTAGISYTEGTEEREEMLGTAIVQLASVTLLAPEMAVKPQFQVSGSAPPGAKVTVYDGTEMIGTADTSPAGIWQLEVKLANTSTMKHAIRTEAGIDGKRLAGEEAVVLYDPNDPGLEEVSMRQSDGRKQTFRTENGVAVFPFVYVPGQPFVYELKFRDPARVSDVQVWMGNTSADARLENGVYVAAMMLKSDPGPVTVTYHKKDDPSQLSFGSPPSESELRNTLPTALRNFQVLSVMKPGEAPPGGEPLPPRTLTGQIQLNEQLGANISLSSSPADGLSPSEKELQRQQLTGLPVFGVSVQRSHLAAKDTITLRAVIPGGEGENGGFSGKAASKTSMALGPEEIALVFEVLNRGTQAYDLGSAVTGLMSPGTIERINADYEAALAICDPKASEYYANMAMEIKYDIAIHEFVKNGVNILSTKLGGAEALVFWVESYWAGKILDDLIESELAELESYLKQYDCKLKPYPEKPPGSPAAKPKYIYDPSGYVYEGLPDNRLDGITATALELDPETGDWNVWNADWYEQRNPQITDSGGRYGWDVPPGKWKIRYEKDGYETGYSGELDVPPPRFDVNVPLVSYQPPKIAYIKAYPGGGKLQIQFTKPVEVDSVLSDVIRVKDPSGLDVIGAVQALNPGSVEDGKQLAIAVEFIPTVPFTAGETYQISVKGSVLSYAGVPMGTDFTEVVVIAAEDRMPPAEVSSLNGGMSGDSVSLVWRNPEDNDFASVRLRWKKAGADRYGDPIDVEQGQQWAVVDHLDDTEAYDFQVTAVDESGNESDGVHWGWNPAEILPDLGSPPPVSELIAMSTGKDTIKLTWNDPTAEDLKELQINWSGETDLDPIWSARAMPGTNAYTIADLKPSTKYKITVVALDESGNKSVATVIEAETKPASSGPGPTPGNSGADDSASEQLEGSLIWAIGKSGGTFSAFDNKLNLEVKAGTFVGDMKIHYSRIDDPQEVLPIGYHRYSSSFKLGGGGAKPGLPMVLTLAYDPSAVASGDVRRLGVYGKDSSAPAGWTYIGGVVDDKRHLITAKLRTFGEYAVLMYDHPFADQSAHWSQPDVDVLVSRQLVNGVKDNLFEPDRPITRAEMTKLLLVLLEREGIELSVDQSIGASFADVSRDAWYASYVERAAGFGLVQGANGRFRPNDPITREEMAVMFVRLAGLMSFTLPDIADNQVLSRFGDAGQLSEWSREAFIHAVSQGWIHGVAETVADPRGKATRAQAAVLLLRVMDSLGQLSVRS